MVQNSDHILQLVLAEADLEVDRPSAMASIIVRKLHRKRCLWTGSTCAMVLAG